MGYLIEGYKILGRETADWIVKNRAHIGTAVSISGTILSNVLSTKAGAKSARMIDAKAIELGRPLSMKEKAELCWKNHITSGATAALSCVGAAYSDNTHVKNFNKLATTYATSKRIYDATRRATREVLGEKKNLELQDKLNKKKIEENPEAFEKKVAEAGENPRPGVYQRYYESTTGEIIWTNRDKINLALEVMRAEMEGMAPRAMRCGYLNSVRGVKLRRFFELASDISKDKLKAKVYDLGFNKGQDPNGSDDDQIDVYFTPMLINDDSEAIICINWSTEPSDMTYGDYFKS